MKKVISILLTFVLLFTMAVPAFAAPNMDNPPEKIENYDGLPVIVVRGINFGGIYNKDTGKGAISIDGWSVINFVMNILSGTLLFKSDEALADSLVDFIWDVMGDVACDAEGNSANPSIVAEQCPTAMINHADFLAKTPYKTAEGVLQSAVARLGGENTYFLNFDWRAAPWDLAEQLDALVETAKADHNVDKVKIICASMGAMATTAYFHYKYDGTSVDSCTFLSGAHNGGYVAGEALNGRLEADADAIYNILTSLVSGEQNWFLRLFIKLIDFSGLFDVVAEILNRVLEANMDKIYDEALFDLFGRAVGLWGICPDDVFDSGVEFFYGDKKDEYPVMMDKLAECRDFVTRTEEILQKVDASGVKLTFLSDYNKGLIPLYAKSVENGDVVLETKLTSNGATVAPTGQTLSQEYLDANPDHIISPDKVIDASTCLFPDRTWFFKDAGHVAADYGTEYNEFVFKLVFAEEQPTVTTYPEYPQFMIADSALNIEPLK